ncbi:hypothetical protein VNO77_20038 [Canavalia gladiata]|uniref:Uncharacterized protein n=1 Tax=Canavalia gladiata TaxID=3824 RepID=A0AAN9LNL5_CANGL
MKNFLSYFHNDFLHFFWALPVLVQSQPSRTHHPPGPRGLPIIGNLHQLHSSILNLQPWKFSKIYDYIPFLRWIDKFTRLLARLEKTFKAFDLFLLEVIVEHLNSNRLKKENEEKEDKVDVLHELKRQDLMSIDLTNDHIKAIILVCAHAFPFFHSVLS